MEINDVLKTITKDDVNKLIALLQAISSTNETDTDNETQSDNSQPFVQNNRNQKTPKIIRTNKFLDMPESKMHKDDTLIDKKLSQQPPVPRSRDFEPIKVMCRVCNKTEFVSPSLVENASRYKCNKCSTNPG